MLPISKGLPEHVQASQRFPNAAADCRIRAGAFGRHKNRERQSSFSHSKNGLENQGFAGTDRLRRDTISPMNRILRTYLVLRPTIYFALSGVLAFGFAAGEWALVPASRGTFNNILAEIVLLFLTALFLVLGLLSLYIRGKK